MEYKYGEMMKQIIVLACGVFDLIHVGHIRLLKNAKGLCGQDGRLVVAVTTDKCCKKEKGQIPVMSYEHRRELLESIKHVDLVVPQYSRNKERILREIQPTYLVAGNDWSDSGLDGTEKFKEHGGKVIFFPYTKFISTTELIKRINKKGAQNP